MIKRLITVLVTVALLLSGSVLASDNQGPLTSEDFLRNATVGMGWGGPAIGAWYPNLDGLNDVLEVKLDVPLILFSGSGEGGLIPGFSLGGFGGGNSIIEKNVRLDVGFGGVMFNRTFPFKEGHWYYGGIIGGGRADLVINHGETPSDVGEAVEAARQTYLQTTFFALGPQVGLQIPVTPFIQFKASAGYMFTIGGDWELVGRGELPGGKVDWSGPMAQIGIVFGGSARISPPIIEDATVNL